MKPLVSILVPAYNAAPYIAETLDSALAQTWQNIEIVVVDDGSRDDTLAIAKTYESKRVKVISQENKGASTARNRALKAAQGDFIQYLDADDLLAPDKIERQLKLSEFDRNSDYVTAHGKYARGRREAGRPGGDKSGRIPCAVGGGQQAAAGGAGAGAGGWAARAE